MEERMRVISEKKGAVTTIIINRPEVRNAVDRPTAEELAEAFRAFEADKEARAAVLTGTGGYFCAGADLKGFTEGRGRGPTDYSIPTAMSPER
jgi:enoyl-CoA hydratase